MAYFDNLFMENSLERMIALLSDWTDAGADRDEVEKKIWSTFGEDWTVMFTDLSGFSRKVADFGIIHFINVIIESEKLFTPIIHQHNGFLIKREGDSLMLLFRQPGDALACALDMQRACQRYSATKPGEDKVILCLGMSHGRILRLGSNEVFGAAVNSASKLGEDTAGPNEILVTEEFVEAMEGGISMQLELIDYEPPGSKRAYRVTYDKADPNTEAR